MSKNVVVELIRDEDGSIAVNKCSMGEWNWMAYIMPGSQQGGIEPIDFDNWEQVETRLNEQFSQFQKDETESGFYEAEWQGIKEEYINTVKNDIAQAIKDYHLQFIQIGGYSVEYDNCIIVVYGIQSDE